jgi:tRNA A-37 threonylcarbamoyl transferase component Bud32
LTNQALLKIHDDIQRAARTIALEWPNIIAEDEAAQEIALALLVDNYVDTVIDMDVAARRHVLKKIGQHIAANYRTEYERHSGQYHYSSHEVRAILDRGALSEQQTTFNAGTADVRVVWDALNDTHQQFLINRYVFGADPGDTNERKRVSRAVDALTALLNRAMRAKAVEGHEGPGARCAVSNTLSVALTRRQA